MTRGYLDCPNAFWMSAADLSSSLWSVDFPASLYLSLRWLIHACGEPGGRLVSVLRVS